MRSFAFAALPSSASPSARWPLTRRTFLEIGREPYCIQPRLVSIPVIPQRPNRGSAMAPRRIGQ
jgi:hypothetical protein